MTDPVHATMGAPPFRAPKCRDFARMGPTLEGLVLDDPLVCAVAMWLVEVAGGPVMLLVNGEDDLFAVYAAPFFTELPS